MNLKAEKPKSPSVDVDALLQDSYLLVVELRQGASALTGRDLWKRCSNQVEQMRQQLSDAGVSQRSIDHISYAQCALLDETVLGAVEGEVHTEWAGGPLQARFFNRHQAGEFLYEDMREVLREPSPDPQVLTAFQRVLMLGFKGRYRVDDPEREQLLAALNAQVAPLAMHSALISRAGRAGGLFLQRWLAAPLLQVLLAGLLLAGTWWGLNHLLGQAIAKLLPGMV